MYSEGLGGDSYPMVELDSDEERIDSSDDELNVILHGTPEQRRRLRRRSLGQKSSSDDDFEKEMEDELTATMNDLHKKHTSTASSDVAGTASGSSDKTPEFYDNTYFDSDSDDDGTKQEKSSRKHPVISNDDLLYDPDIDDKNQNWVDKQRRKYQTRDRKPTQGSQHQTQSNRPKPLPHSDAVLNCPACMTVLCLDCQRHDIYQNQYRAMFVMNCQIDSTEVLRFPVEGPKGRKNKKKKHNKQKLTSDSATDTDTTNCDHSNMDTSEQPGASDGLDMFNPVKCKICTSEVGVYDKDEVYHFFNVLTSYG